MLTEIPRISLTIQLEGSHRPRFVYDKEEGKKVRYYGKTVMQRDPKTEEYSPGFVPCEGKTQPACLYKELNEKFVLNALKEPIKGYKRNKWRELPEKSRINKHVRELAKALLHTNESIDHRHYSWHLIPEEFNF